MAFPVIEQGRRVGHFSLNLTYNGNFARCYSDIDTELRCEALGGGSPLGLSDGEQFDRMQLFYTRTEATEDSDPSCGSGDPTVNINSTIGSLLPFNGAPEDPRSSPDIGYVLASSTVPEPATVATTMFGLGLIGVMVRKKNRQGPRSST